MSRAVGRCMWHAMSARGVMVSLAVVAAYVAFSGRVHAQSADPFTNCRPGDPKRFLGNRVEPIAGRPGAERIVLSGDVSIVCGDLTLFADEITYETDTRKVVAAGAVTFQQPSVSIFAERAEIDGQTKLGTFYNAHGTARVGDAPTARSAFGTAEPDVIFQGAEITRTGERSYRLRGGGFTTCAQATPRWEIVGGEASIVLDKRVLMKHMVLKVKDVPLLYLPAIYYPINKEDRSTGFLLPTYGSSTIGGTSLSNAFFWAINRSQDATFYHDWNAKSGQGMKADYRYVASPVSQGQMSFRMLADRELLDTNGVVVTPARRSYGITGNAFQTLPRGFRLSASADYFTSADSLQRQQDISAYSQRTRSWNANLAGTVGRVRISAAADQNDLFYGADTGQRYGQLPTVSLSLNDSTIGRTRIYYGAAGQVGYLLRQNDLDDPTTDRSLWRIDASPTIRAPLSRLPFLTATGSLSWRFTRWFESIDPLTDAQVPVPLTRQLFDMRATVTGPVLSRVFQTPNNGYAERFKHLIEPTFSIQRTTAFRNLNRVVLNDYGIDGLVGGNTTINYRLTNKLLARRRGPAVAPGAPPPPGIVRDILTVELGQSYYTDGRAARYDTTYQSGSEADVVKGTFSPLLLSAVSRPVDTASMQFRMEIDSKYRKVREYGASGTIENRNVTGTGGWSKRQVIPGLAYYDEANARQFLNGSATVRTRDNRVGGTYAMNLDVKNRGFLQQRIVAYYNSQCCGVSFDWQAISTPLYRGYPTDRRFGLSFTLAGIGSFSNPMGAFGGAR